MPLELSIDSKSTATNDVAILRLKGNFDATSSQSVRDAIAASLRSNNNRLLLDFSLLRDIDGFALATLIRLYHRVVYESAGVLVLSGVNPDIRKFLDLSGMARVLTICQNEQEALDLCSR